MYIAKTLLTTPNAPLSLTEIYSSLLAAYLLIICLWGLNKFNWTHRNTLESNGTPPLPPLLFNALTTLLGFKFVDVFIKAALFLVFLFVSPENITPLLFIANSVYYPFVVAFWAVNFLIASSASASYPSTYSSPPGIPSKLLIPPPKAFLICFYMLIIRGLYIYVDFNIRSLTAEIRILR
ncbi:hypothetical protein BDK51DRAFT_26845, partial [Blyttiomyces helicus]